MSALLLLTLPRKMGAHVLNIRKEEKRKGRRNRFGLSGPREQGGRGGAGKSALFGRSRRGEELPPQLTRASFIMPTKWTKEKGEREKAGVNHDNSAACHYAERVPPFRLER